MSRELKFRAWDGEKMRYDVTGFEHGVKNEMAGIFLDGEYWSLSAGSLHARMNERSAVVMQWTGLKDKNGVEIYEGDILREPGGPSSRGRLYKSRVIEWIDCGGGYNLFATHVSSEVIGNKFQHPELLEQQS